MTAEKGVFNLLDRKNTVLTAENEVRDFRSSTKVGNILLVQKDNVAIM